MYGSGQPYSYTMMATGRHLSCCCQRLLEIHVSPGAAFLLCTQNAPEIKCVGLASTIYLRCIYSVFGREITKDTVIYGIYGSRPTLQMRPKCAQNLLHT